MVKKIEWPTAVVITFFVAAYTALTLAGKPVPEWLAAAGTLAAGVAKQLVRPS